MDKEDVIHTYNGILVIKIEGNPAIGDNLGGPGGYYAK